MPAVAADTLQLSNRAGGGDAIAILSGKVWPFCKMVSESSSGNSIPLSKNFRPPENCPSRLILFSPGNAFEYKNPFAPPEITTDRSDNIPVPLSGLVGMHVYIFVATCEYAPGQFCDSANPGPNIVMGEARQEIEKANEIFSTQLMGVEFSYEIRDISGSATGIESRCPPPVRTDFVSKHLNIYYISSGAAQRCDCMTGEISDDCLVIYVKPSDSSTTLAHEIGHALGLGHVDPMKTGGLSYNIMKTVGGDCRHRFVAGQRYWTNVCKKELLNSPFVGPPRNGPTSPCDGTVEPPDLPQQWVAPIEPETLACPP